MLHSNFMRRCTIVLAVLITLVILAPNFAGAQLTPQAKLQAKPQVKSLFDKYADWFIKKPKGTDGTYFLDLRIVSVTQNAVKATYIDGNISSVSIIRTKGKHPRRGYIFKGSGKQYTDIDTWYHEPEEGAMFITSPPNPFDPKKAKNVTISINTLSKTAKIGNKTIDFQVKNGILYGFTRPPVRKPGTKLWFYFKTMYNISLTPKFNKNVSPPR